MKGSWKTPIAFASYAIKAIAMGATEVVVYWLPNEPPGPPIIASLFWVGTLALLAALCTTAAVIGFLLAFSEANSDANWSSKSELRHRVFSLGLDLFVVIELLHPAFDLLYEPIEMRRHLIWIIGLAVFFVACLGWDIAALHKLPREMRAKIWTRRI